MITIPQIIFFFLNRNVSPENIPDRSVFGKAYHQWLNSDWPFPEGYKFKPFNLALAPIPYEVQFNLSNASDCQDWMKEHTNDILKEIELEEKFKNKSLTMAGQLVRI